MALKTCNESGKTQVVIASLVLWHLTVFPAGMVQSTSGSWRQIKSQLVPALHAHQHKFPDLKFNATTITRDGLPRWQGLSTNDAGKFEGQHGDPEKPLLITADECKTVKDDIFEAIDRCNAQRVLLASSPGFSEGEFWRAFGMKAKFYERFSMQASDCPHIPQESIDKRIAKWGLNHPLVRSMIFAEFMEQVEDAILTMADLDRCLADPPPWNQSSDRKAFCDFAAGGDENVLALREGNRVRIIDAWRDSNTMSGCGRFIMLFVKHGLKPHEIEGDADGLGKVMIDALREAGWPIVGINSNDGPIWDDHYFNRISEIWHEGAKQIKLRSIILMDDADEDLRGQLISRKQQFHSKGKLWMESKKEMKARGLPSPDRADAVLGAMSPSIVGKSQSMVPSSAAEDYAMEHGRIDERILAGMDAGG